MALLSARQLTIATSRAAGRRQPLVSGLEMAVEPGSCVLVLGDHGSGKSRLLAAIAGLNPALAGELTILGHPAGSRLASRAVGWASEDAQWPRGLRVEDSLLELASVSGLARLSDRLGQVMLATSLTDAARVAVAQLSSGQRRLLSTAQALLDDPPLLLLDGVLDALATAARERVIDALAERLTLGAAVLLSTHQPELFGSLATHALFLEGGHASFAPLHEGREQEAVS